MARSMTIARTEGHRVQSEAKMDSYHAAKAKGADIVKQWDATLDSSTRDTHRLLDGQVREIDEDFTVMGMSAPYPGGFGDPAEDCNCRCCMLQRARWAVDDETSYDKWNNETGGIIQCTGYKDFEEKYLKAAENLTEHAESDKISTGIDVLDSAKRLEHHDIDDCFDTTNPHFMDGREYQVNCQRCVSAYEARRRGYDVTARKAPGGADTLPYMLGPKGWASVYKDGVASLETLSGSRSSSILDSIVRRMTEFGDGARAIIRVQWQRGRGHVFIAEQANGVTQFIDPQTGNRNCADYFKSGMIKPSSTRLLRVDDKEFTDLIEECVTNNGA